MDEEDGDLGQEGSANPGDCTAPAPATIPCLPALLYAIDHPKAHTLTAKLYCMTNSRCTKCPAKLYCVANSRCAMCPANCTAWQTADAPCAPRAPTLRSMSSANTHPMPHMSTAELYCWAPKSSSGGRYHLAHTWLVSLQGWVGCTHGLVV
jgi:hypothetical protein